MANRTKVSVEEITSQALSVTSGGCGAEKDPMSQRIFLVENFLRFCFRDEEIPAKLSEAMRYSLLAGGKRIRPVLCLSCARLCGADFSSILPFAAGLEMIHTYSLIHDDLPAMDNDDLRRGKASCHKKFDEATAILAGDGLLSDAFWFMCQCKAEPRHILEAVSLAARAAGAPGMVGGQILDLQSEGKKISLEELAVLNAKKTGALLRVACEAGAVLAGASAEKQNALRMYGEYLGLAFQITDDVLDVVGDSTLLGKNTGRDAENEKSAWPALIGLEASKAEALHQCEKARKTLDVFLESEEKEFLKQIANNMAHRIR